MTVMSMSQCVEVDVFEEALKLRLELGPSPDHCPLGPTSQ
jgi:hypothetical protein